MKLVTIIADMADGTEVRETVGAGELLAFARIVLPLRHDPACRRVRWVVPTACDVCDVCDVLANPSGDGVLNVAPELLNVADSGLNVARAYERNGRGDHSGPAPKYLLG